MALYLSTPVQAVVSPSLSLSLRHTRNILTVSTQEEEPYSKGLLIALRTMRRGELARVTVKPVATKVEKEATKLDQLLEKMEETPTKPDSTTPLETPASYVVDRDLFFEVELLSFITKMEIGEELQKWLLFEGNGWDVPRFSSTCKGSSLPFQKPNSVVTLRCTDKDESQVFWELKEPTDIVLGVDCEEGNHFYLFLHLIVISVCNEGS